MTEAGCLIPRAIVLMKAKTKVEAFKSRWTTNRWRQNGGNWL